MEQMELTKDEVFELWFGLRMLEGSKFIDQTLLTKLIAFLTHTDTLTLNFK